MDAEGSDGTINANKQPLFFLSLAYVTFKSNALQYTALPKKVPNWVT